MKEDLKQLAGSIIKTVDEIRLYKNNLIKAKAQIKDLEDQLTKKLITKAQFNAYINKLLRGQKIDQYTSSQEQKIFRFLDQIDTNLTTITSSISIKQEIKTKEDIYEVHEAKPTEINVRYIKDLVKKRKKKKDQLEIPNYSLYKTTQYGKISNIFMESFSDYLTKNYNSFFISLYKSLKSSGILILSKTYISIILFSSILTFFIGTLVFFLMFQSLSVISIVNSIFLGIFLASSTFVGLFYYPSIVSSSRRSKIKNDLPFVIVHMAAVAGSGANPISMFNLILTSKEFKGVENDVKKIVNYVNLFGYNLTTSLKLVALTTPSKEFREFLSGLVTIIETGGNLKQYLTAKAEDATTSYKLNMKKYVESLATYSDVYTGILIAGPLLFFSTLAIIQVLGGSLFGVSASVIGLIGTFIVIPSLNLLFLLFISIIQPEI